MDENHNSEDEKKKHDSSHHIHLRSSFKHFLQSFWHFIRETMNLKEGAEIPGTISGIKRDIPFRGHSVWILICSIFIASIGLNVNGSAVIIGAMLISPLMGPILGIGLAIGTNDWETLTLSLKNFGIMVFVSILTSTIYFSITPLHDIQSELLARTKPTFLDVLIAIFGGMAGIIAGSRKEKSNVIPGVAIATALMPPLCTAGYGLANGNLNFFFGAFYLFFLNSVFICLSTVIIVRYLHFPTKNFVDPIREKRLKRYMIIFIIIVILPSAKIFWSVIKESRFYASADQFITENVRFKGSEIINRKITYSDTLSYIDLYMIGEEVSENQISKLSEKLDEYGMKRKGSFWKTGTFSTTDNTEIRIHQAKDKTEAIVDSKINYLSSNLGKEVRQGIIEDLFKKNEKIIQDKDSMIALLKNELQKRTSEEIPFYNIESEIKVQYERVDRVAYGKTIETIRDDSTEIMDTIPTFLVKWNRNAWRSLKQKQRKQMSEWLKVRLQLDTVRVIEF